MLDDRLDPLGQANTAPLVDAADITRGARLARPMSMMLAAGAVVSAGLVVAALIGALSGAPRGSERILIGVLAGATSLLTGVLVLRTLRARWRNGPAVLRFDRSAGRTLIAGLATLGALELVAHGGVVLGVDLAPRPLLRLALALIAAGLAGGLPLVTRRPRRED